MATSEERSAKIESNKEIYDKMSGASSGLIGDDFVNHHAERCNRG